MIDAHMRPTSPVTVATDEHSLHCNTLQHTATDCNTLQHPGITTDKTFSKVGSLDLLHTIVYYIQSVVFSFQNFTARLS